eukprot:gnl/TRDRNA2_/TRDRNA2_183232_c0_seq1.p1 gnl/TRDRNA2_/TRDRNA2_183232_c0~~gnl/TRDRNA2_/TRDRNA2_183232_c0_seq1.p1  ORF type:complete len:386 (-),score=46.36 gnl/TRDRNA2_/TRDRNA2_183232_c0_seq1:88-1245(-)
MAFRYQRWTLANLLPVCFMHGIILTIWLIYIRFHLLKLLRWQPVTDDYCNDCGSFAWLLSWIYLHRGVLEAVISQSLTALLLISFGRAISVDPGSVPESNEWLDTSFRTPEDASSSLQQPEETTGAKVALQESKHTGARRFCKWCQKYKPDRTHHCRVCRSCILKMDHHCPWIANCVGFHNHKYFFLVVSYAVLNCLFIIVTMSETLYLSIMEETSFYTRFAIVFGLTLSSMMGLLMACFLFFHIWMMMRATTTIEFCEKRLSHPGGHDRGTSKSIYDQGVYKNIQAVLGENPLIWMIPGAMPPGDGLSFPVNADPNERTYGQRKSANLRPSAAAHGMHMEAESNMTPKARAPSPRLSSNGEQGFEVSEEDDSSPEVTGAPAAAS